MIDSPISSNSILEIRASILIIGIRTPTDNNIPHMIVSTVNSAFIKSVLNGMIKANKPIIPNKATE